VARRVFKEINESTKSLVNATIVASRLPDHPDMPHEILQNRFLSVLSPSLFRSRRTPLLFPFSIFGIQRFPCEARDSGVFRILRDRKLWTETGNRARKRLTSNCRVCASAFIRCFRHACAYRISPYKYRQLSWMFI